MYKRLARFAQRDSDWINVFLKRLVYVTGSSYERLCLRLYLALCLEGSSERSLWLLSDVILLNKVVPKCLHFSYKGMVARTQLAVIDHNSNTERNQATVTRGKNKREKKYKLIFPKGQRKWVAKPDWKDWKVILICTRLDGSSFSGENDTTDDEHTTVTACIPKDITPIPRPSREEVITAHRTRMMKKQ